MIESEKLFDKIHPNDVAQGVLGDCWLLAGLATLAEFPGAIQNIFQEKKCSPEGKYTLRFFDSVQGQWNFVVVDDFIPVSAETGETVFSKPNGNEMWVLLAEKACAKWFGSYIRLQGAYTMLPFLIFTDVGKCQAFKQADLGVYQSMNCYLTDAHDRKSVMLQPGEEGMVSTDDLWQKLLEADANNFAMAAWTDKEPPVAIGYGASGEAIASDGIVKGHAYSIISAKLIVADGYQWCVLQIRNPWGANPSAEWKGALSDNWNGWERFSELKERLGISTAGLDGMFWMTWRDFVYRYSDVGIVPKSMKVPKKGAMELMGQSSDKQFVKPESDDCSRDFGPPFDIDAFLEEHTIAAAE